MASSPRLRLAPHFALVGCVSAAVLLSLTSATPSESYAMAAAYVALLAVVGHFARPTGWWWVGLFVANWAFLFALSDATGRTNQLVFSGIGALFYSGLCSFFFGAFVRASTESHEAREWSLAASAERRYVLMASLVLVDYVAAIYVGLRYPAWLLGAVVASLATKLGTLAMNEWTVRQIRRTRAAGLRETSQLPSPDVPQVDLGVGDEVRVQRDDASTYRDAPQTTRAVLGSVEESVQLVRRYSRRYIGIVACTWVVLAFLVWRLLSA